MIRNKNSGAKGPNLAAISRIIGIAALAAVIGIGLAGCPTTAEEEGESEKSAVNLTLDTWADGNLASGGEQWFKFTATAETQYIHIAYGTLGSYSYFRLYSGPDAPVGGSWSGTPQNKSVTIGKVYYIKVYGGSGTYKIGITESSFSPDTLAAMASAPVLTPNTWGAQRTLASGGEQWFKFTATAETQYIHIAYGTLSQIYSDFRLYSDPDAPVGGSWSGTPKSKSVTIGKVYYIRAYGAYGSSGIYKIAFNTSSDTPPQ
jgi:hypothetical protein